MKESNAESQQPQCLLGIHFNMIYFLGLGKSTHVKCTRRTSTRYLFGIVWK